jgi:large subunit ribosomal protein L18
MKVVTKADFRKRRHLRLRKKIQGTSERPRLSVFVSNRHLYVQLIDDLSGRTLAAASTQSEGYEGAEGKNNLEAAKQVGTLAAKLAREKGIEKVVFDRGGFSYRGRVQALADAARAGGLQF